MNKTTKYDASEWIDFALNLCRGSYQRDIVTGRARLSGSDLRGKASKWSMRYAASRAAIVDRCKAAGIPICEVRGKRGLRQLCIAGRVL